MLGNAAPEIERKLRGSKQKFRAAIEKLRKRAQGMTPQKWTTLLPAAWWRALQRGVIDELGTGKRNGSRRPEEEVRAASCGTGEWLLRAVGASPPSRRGVTETRSSLAYFGVVGQNRSRARRLRCRPRHRAAHVA